MMAVSIHRCGRDSCFSSMLLTGLVFVVFITRDVRCFSTGTATSSNQWTRTAFVVQAESNGEGSSASSSSSPSAKEEQEPDLFDYFDPLLSPHAYPDGIAPGNKPVDPQLQRQQEQQNTASSNDFGSMTPPPSGLDDISKVFASSSASFLNMDPTNPQQQQQQQPSSSSTTTSNEPLPLSDIGFDNMAKPSMQKGAVFDPDYFDPTLSPHAYPNGTPDKWVGDTTPQEPPQPKVTGILLMDHGSRNQASNDRLHELADIYQQSVGGPIVVKAAHMEIAKPSIPDGLQALLDAGVGE